MPKIKNDPTTYLRRSDLAFIGGLTADMGMSASLLSKNERDFMTAPIDKAFYIDFNPSSRIGFDDRPRKRHPK